LQVNATCRSRLWIEGIPGIYPCANLFGSGALRDEGQGQICSARGFGPYEFADCANRQTAVQQCVHFGYPGGCNIKDCARKGCERRGKATFEGIFDLNTQGGSRGHGGQYSSFVRL
jgi:hypothetical protein